MTDRERDQRREIEQLQEHQASMECRIRRLEELIDLLRTTVRNILHYLRCHRAPPGAPRLDATFTFSGAHMLTTLVASIPTLRQDGTPLAATDIASITFQRSSGGQPPTVVITNVAGAGGLTPDQITAEDTGGTVGDVYSCFVTDTNGSAGAISNEITATAPAVPSPPGAPSLSATFA